MESGARSFHERPSMRCLSKNSTQAARTSAPTVASSFASRSPQRSLQSEARVMEGANLLPSSLPACTSCHIPIHHLQRCLGLLLFHCILLIIRHVLRRVGLLLHHVLLILSLRNPSLLRVCHSLSYACSCTANPTGLDDLIRVLSHLEPDQPILILLPVQIEML